jgi:hypothetical protein
MDEHDIPEQNVAVGWQGDGSALAGAGVPVDLPRAPAPRPSTGQRVLRLSRKVGVAAAGGSLLVLGVALIFLPGPAIVVIPLGLALLATEFRWAGRLLGYLKERASRAVKWARRAVARDPGRTGEITSPASSPGRSQAPSPPVRDRRPLGSAG